MFRKWLKWNFLKSSKLRGTEETPADWWTVISSFLLHLYCRRIERRISRHFEKCLIYFNKVVSKSLSTQMLYVYHHPLESLIPPIQRGVQRISSTAFLSRRPSGYYLPNWSCDLLKVTKVWMLTVALFILLFYAKCVVFVTGHITKLGMKGLLKAQQGELKDIRTWYRHSAGRML